jgi:hypothetical protein
MSEKAPAFSTPLTFLDLPSQETKVGVGIVNKTEAEVCHCGERAIGKEAEVR